MRLLKIENKLKIRCFYKNDDVHIKQKERARHKKFRAQPYKKNLQVFQGEEDDGFQIVIYFTPFVIIFQ